MESLLLTLSILSVVFGIALLIFGIHAYVLTTLDKIEDRGYLTPYICTTIGIILLLINHYYLL